MLNSTQLAEAALSQELPRQLQAIAQNLNTAVGSDGTIQAGNAGLAASANDLHAPAANMDAVVTYAAAGAGLGHIISGVSWSYNADPTGGILTVKDGATTVRKFLVTKSGPGFIPFARPLEGTANTALEIRLTAAGAAVTGTVMGDGHTTGAV